MPPKNDSAPPLSPPGPLVEPEWLRDHLDEVRILDVRMETRSFAGPLCPEDEAMFADTPLKGLTGHIPGAVSVPWKSVVSQRVENGIELQGMRPTAEAFQALMQECGVNKNQTIVVCGRCADLKELAVCTRLYWTLKYFGHDSITLLNGGVANWIKQGNPLEHHAVTPPPGHFQIVEERTDLLADLEQTRQTLLTKTWKLLDARTLDVYLGLTAPGIVRPNGWGHIPGAKLFSANLVAHQLGPACFYDPEVIDAAARAVRINPEAPSITYCNSGVFGSTTWFALHEILGNKQVRLFDGSMHQWTKTPGYSVIRLMIE